MAGHSRPSHHHSHDSHDTTATLCAPSPTAARPPPRLLSLPGTVAQRSEHEQASQEESNGRASVGGVAFPPSPPFPRPCPSRPPQPLAAAMQASGWLSAEKVSEEISKLLVAPLKEHYTQHHQVNSDNVTLELELVRAIGAENRKQGEGGCKVRARGGGRRGRAYGIPAPAQHTLPVRRQAAVRRLLEHSKCVDVLTEFVSQKARCLMSHGHALAAEGRGAARGRWKSCWPPLPLRAPLSTTSSSRTIKAGRCASATPRTSSRAWTG